MIRFVTILIGCSLALAAGVRAEQAAQEDPKKKPVQKSKPVQKQQFTPKQHTAPNAHVQGVHTQQTVPNTHVQGVHTQQTVPNPHVQGAHTQHKDTTIPNNTRIHDSNVSKQQLHTAPAVQTNRLPAVQTNKVPAVQTNRLPAVQTKRQTVQRVQSQHVNFHAQPNSAITSVRFNQHYHINGSENWHGAHYQVFQSYHPQWHDRGWWHSHHNNLVLIGGGWYFWNAGYWFPAWGYDSAAAYYPYDGPIYVGNNPRPFDQVVADAQSILQEQGYYHGEVDGLVGPLTQEALADYQRAQGLEATAAIDQPTLESLGLG